MGIEHSQNYLHSKQLVATLLSKSNIWDYAQSIAPNIFIGIGKTLGLVEIVLCISLLFLNISAQSTVFAGVAVGIIFLFFGFYKTETGIKNKFLDDKF